MIALSLVALLSMGQVQLGFTKKAIACIGDSTSVKPEGGPYGDGPWIGYAQTALGNNYGLAPKGKSGDTAALAYTRWNAGTPTIKTQTSWDAVVLLIGVNDLNAGTSAATIETQLQNFETSLAGMSPRPVLYYVRVLPWGGYSGQWSSADEAIGDTLWAWQQTRCSAGSYIRCINTASLADAGSPPGQPSLPASYTSDGIHLTATGASAVGSLIAAAILADPP